MKTLKILVNIIIIASICFFGWSAYSLFTAPELIYASDDLERYARLVYVLPAGAAAFMLFGAYLCHYEKKSAKMYLALLLLVPIMLAAGYFANESVWGSSKESPPAEESYEDEDFPEGVEIY